MKTKSVICHICKKIFEVSVFSHSKERTCQDCKYVNVQCINCGEPFDQHFKSNSKFCSNSCANKYNGKMGKIGGNISSLPKMIKLYGECEGTRRYEERIKKIGDAHRGKPSGMTGKKHSLKTKRAIGQSVRESEYHESIRGKSFEEIYGPGSLEKHKEKMQGVFSLKWFEDKFGSDMGQQLYNERSRRLKENSHFHLYNKNNQMNYSSESQKLFWSILAAMRDIDMSDVYFAELNHEYGCSTNRNFDFVWLSKKRVIEYNGDFWHANPHQYSSDDIMLPSRQLTAKEIWESDKEKIRSAERNGFKVHIVWESDYANNHNRSLQECIKFLKS